MILKILRLAKGRLGLILPLLAFVAVMAGVIQVQDQPVAAWSEDLTARHADPSDSHLPPLVFSPDGRTILTVSDSESGSRLREAETGRLLAKLSSDRVRFPTFFHEDKLIAGQTYSRETKFFTIHVWDAATGRSLASIKQRDGEAKGRKFATSRASGVLAVDPGIVIGPDGVSTEKGFTIWDSARGLSPNKFPGAPRCCFGLSPDGKTLYLETSDEWGVGPYREHPVMAWDVETGKSIGQIEPTVRYGRGFDVDYDGRLFLYSANERETRLVDRRKQTSKPIPGGFGRHEAAYFPGGRSVMPRGSGSTNGKVEIDFGLVDLDANPPRVLSFEDISHATPDARRMTRIAGPIFYSSSTESNRLDSKVKVLDDAGIEVAKFHGSGVLAAVLSPDGRRVALLQARIEPTTLAWLAEKVPTGWFPVDSGSDPLSWTEAIVYEVDTGRRLATIPVADVACPAALTFSPSGDRLAVELPNFLATMDQQSTRTVKLWAVPTRRHRGLAWTSASASALLALSFGRWLDGRSRRRQVVMT